MTINENPSQKLMDISLSLCQLSCGDKAFILAEEVTWSTKLGSTIMRYVSTIS